MAFTLDTKARFPTSASTTTTATTLATGYTCGSYVGALVVYLFWAGTTARTGGDPTYAGSALTQASTKQSVTETSVETWYMLSPPSGSYTLSIPNSGGRTMWVHIASANTTSASVTFAYDSVGTNAITAANPGVSVVTVATHTIVFAGVGTGDNSWSPTGRTGTFIYDDDIGTYGSGTQYVIKTSAGSSTIGWTDSTSDDYNAIGVAFKETPRGWTLTTGCPVHLLTSGSVDLTQHVPEYTLTTGCPVQLHTADNVTITFHNLLVVQNTEQLHTSEHVILTQNYSLVSNNSTHIQTSENINLTQHYSITSNSAEQKQTAENVSLTAHYFLTAQNATQPQTSSTIITNAHIGIICDIDNETGDTSQWSSSSGSQITITTQASLAGTRYGISASISDSSVFYLEKAGLNSTTGVVGLRFYFDTNNITIATTNTPNILFGYNSASTVILCNRLNYYSSNFHINVGYKNDASSWTYSSDIIITSGSHWIETRMTRATGSSTNDGSLSWWIDDNQQTSPANIDNYDMFNSFSKIRAGIPFWGTYTTTNGTLYLDEFVIRDDNQFIGPNIFIRINNAAQAQTSENVNLTQHYSIISNNAEQKQTSGNVNLSAYYAITLNNAEQKQTAENINLTQNYSITVQYATQLQTAENVSLSAHYSLTVQNSTQLQTAEKVNLTQIFSLSINNSAHTHTAGNTLLIQTRYNGARDFNGTTNRIDWSSIIDTTAMPITISAWIKLHTYHVSHTQYIFTTHQSGDTAYGLAFTIYVGLDRLDFFRNGTTLMNRITVTDSIPIGQWVHVLVTHTGLITDYTTVHHYINGIEASYAVGANGAGEYTSNGSWSIGGRIYDDARNLDGEIGEVTVWNRVLNAGEIALLASRNPLKSGTYVPNGLLFTVHPDEPKDLVTGQIGTLDGTTLTYGPNLDFPDYNLTVQNSTQSHTAENVNLTQHYSIISKDSIHSHTSENIILIRGYMLSANNAVQLQTSEDITLIQNYILIVMIATQLQTSDNIFLGGGIAVKTMHYMRLRRT